MLKLFTDTPAQNQPEGTLPFALNALNDTSDGGIGVLVQEHSNRLLNELPGAIAGRVDLYDNQVVLFVEPGYIYLLEEEVLTLLQEFPDFNFSRKYPITGQSTIVNGCERIVYWCDGRNPDRFYNLDKPERFENLNDFRLNPLVNHPICTTQTIDSGGDLRYGSYSFVVEVLDETTNVVLRSFPSTPHYIGSALNIDSFSELTGGQPRSMEAIELTIDNLDENFPFIRIGVILYAGATGTGPVAYYVNDLIPVTGSSISYVYRGDNDLVTDFRQLLTTNPIYETAEVMRSVQGSLLRMNVTEQVDDFAAFQRAASKVEVFYTTELVDPDVDIKTEQGDEIKALAVVFIKRNGQHTPPFHIPGRGRLPSDMELVDSEIFGEVRRWQAENTAYRITETEGKCGYYETESVYRRPLNFCGDDYWGVDATGNNLLLQPVRHHRIPCRSLEPLLEDGKVRRIGLKFSGLEYPSDDVVGHYYVCNEVSPSTATVVAAGYMLPYNTEPDVSGDKREGRYIHYLPNPNDNEQFSNSVRQNFITLQHLTTGRPPQGVFAKVNGFVRTTHTQNRPEFNRFFENNDDLQLYGKHHTVTTYEVQSELLPVMSSRSILRGTTVVNIPNRSLSSDFNIVVLARTPNVFALNRSNLNYTYLKRNTRPFNNLYAIKYRLMGTMLNLEDEQIVYDGDSFISRLDLTNISDINGGTTLANIFGRDNNYVEYELIQGLFLESPINFNRRHAGSEPCNQYYKPEDDINGIIFNKIARRVDEGNTRAWVMREKPCKEWYGYNLDYSTARSRIFVPLTQVFDYCSGCLNKYPNRIIYSQFALAEQTQDAWRVYAALDYVDIPASRGAIINADLYQNDLVIRCVSGAFILQPNAQELQLSGTTAYIGSGKFLSIPAVEIDSSANGYGGQQSRLASCVTPQGIAWVDQNTGNVFLFNGRLSSISRTGMYHYFTQKLKPSQAGHFLGAIVSYDPRFERLLVHYNEFEGGTLNGFYREIDGQQVSYTDDRLVNNCFTISYSFKMEGWTSWHSYQPAFMFYVGTKLYSSPSFDEATGLYVHDDYTKMCTYYGYEHPYMIEIIERPGRTAQISSVEFYTECQINSNGQWTTIRDKTFQQMIAYTNQQSTGLVDLLLTREPYEQARWLTNIKTVIEADQNYRVAGIRDISVNQPVTTNAWLQRAAYYNAGQGYIDTVPTNVNFDLPQYEQVYIRDKYVRIRLVFNDTNARLMTFFYTSRNFPTLR